MKPITKNDVFIKTLTLILNLDLKFPACPMVRRGRPD